MPFFKLSISNVKTLINKPKCYSWKLSYYCLMSETITENHFVFLVFESVDLETLPESNCVRIKTVWIKVTNHSLIFHFLIERFRPSNVPGRSSFLNVQCFWPFPVLNKPQTVENGWKRSWNGHANDMERCNALDHFSIHI